MAKRKHKSSKKIAQSAAALRANGLKAYQRGDYDQAIAAWERIPQEMQPLEALAEVYFQRGLDRLYASQEPSPAGLDDLRQANRYRPSDACYAYHLGLALHRAAELDAAIRSYRAARQAGGEFARRAAYPLALAMLQQEQDPANDPVWKELDALERRILEEASAFRRRPYHLSPDAPRLWRALAALDSGDQATAQAGLQAALASAQSRTEERIAHYYLGVLAAQSEDWATARQEWSAAYAAGLRSQRLEANLGELFHRLAETSLIEGDVQTALNAAQEALRHKPEGNALNELLAQIREQQGYQAALANQWQQARKHWQAAVDLDSSSFRLAYNLALAHERCEDYKTAAETWREALRRRPRRADHPDALSDEQVARLWQRTADLYRKADQPDEATRVYQQAIKWDPENIDLRMNLAESLFYNGQLQAARNELERILDHDPQYIPALLRLGEVFFRSEQWWVKAQAPRCWEKVLQFQPDNIQARQAMAEWYIDQAEIDYSWDDFENAIQDYEKSLEYQPKNAHTIACIADCYIQMGDQDKGRQYIEQALAISSDLDVLNVLIGAWIYAGQPEQAWEMILQAESSDISIPGDFYLAQAIKWLRQNRKPEGLRWIERAVDRSTPEDKILIQIGERLIDYNRPLARQYLEQAIAAGQRPGDAHLLLAMIEDTDGNSRASKKHISEAERIARKTGDAELAARAYMARMMAGGPQAFISRLLDMGGPEAVEDFFDTFGDDEDD